MQSVLSRLKPGDIRREPFPYLVIENALPDALYAQLAESFPSHDNCTAWQTGGTKDTKFVSASNVISNSSIPAVWQEFFELHSHRDFAGRMIDIFADEISTAFPAFAAGWPTTAVGLRKTGDYDFSTDCQFVSTRPKRRVEIVPPHLDDPRELYAGLFYCRAADDTSQGGDLEIFSPKPGYRFYGLRRVRRRHLRFIDSIPYSPNTFVVLLNGPTAFHGVSVRRHANVQRRHLNIIGEYRTTLFPEPPPRIGLVVKQKWAGVKRRIRRIL